MGSVNDFTKGNIVKIILGFYFPMLATNMLQQVYNFTDTAIAEVSAWVGALLMNTAAFITIMRRIMKGENNGKRIRKMGSDNRSKQRNWTSVSRVYGKAGV